MNVLMLTQVLPYPPDSGPKIKTYNVIKYLAQCHCVTLASFVRGDQSEHARHLEQYCQAVHTVPMERGPLRDAWHMGLSFLTGQPFMMLRDDRKAMRDLVARLSAEHSFDMVHADQLNMAQYAERVPGAFKNLDTHNALWLLYKRLWETMSPGLRKWLLGRDWRLLKAYEGRMVRAFDAVLAVTHEDRAALQEAAGQPVDIVVIPITVDTDEVTVVEREAEPRHILHIGTMYWPPNIDAVNWFVREVYPLIRQQRSDAEFDVVGSRPPANLLALNNAGLGINVTGYVEDPTPYQRRAAVMVVPVRAGGGMRVKILDALAEGIPIVSTTLGYEGIEVTPGRDILVGDTPEAFAAEVLRILNDPDLGRQLAANGQRLVKEKYDYRNACRPMDDIYARAVSSRRECPSVVQSGQPNPDGVATKRLSKQSFNVLKIVVSAGLLIYLLAFQVDLRELWHVVRQARWVYLVAAMVLMIAGTALRAVRWRVLLQALDITVPLRRLVHLYFVGAFFNIFLPTGLGGDVVRMAELARSTGRAPEAAGTTLVDRATGLWVLFVLALLALPFSFTLLPQGWAPIIALGTLAGVVGGWAVMATPLVTWLGGKVRLPGQEKLERFYYSVSQLGYRALGKACIVSLIFDVLLILFNVLIAYGLKVDQPLGIFLLFTPIISFSLALPISIGGLGVREQTYVLLFGSLGVSDAAAAAMSLTNYALTNLVVGLLGGGLYALEGTKELTANE